MKTGDTAYAPLRQCFTQTPRLATYLPAFCLPLATFLLNVVGPGHAQAKPASRPGTPSGPQYAISNGGAVWQVRQDGKLVRPDLGEDENFYPYAYGPTLLRVSPDGAMVFAGGEQALTRDSARKVYIEAYRLSPQGRFRLADTFAHEPSGDMPYDLAFGGGRFVYVLTLRGAAAKRPFSTLSSYRVGKGGRVTRLPIPEQRVGVGPDQLSMICDPSGRFVYITRPQGRTVYAYRVTASGLLKVLPSSSVSLSQTPLRLLCPPNGPFLYVVSRNDNSLTQLRRDKDGALHVAHFFRFDSADSKHPYVPPLAITPNGRFLYVRDATDTAIQQYAIEADGALRPLSPPTVAFAPDDISVDLTSRFVYLNGRGITNQVLIHPYRISPSGALVRIKGDPAATVNPASLTFARPR